MSISSRTRAHIEEVFSKPEAAKPQPASPKVIEIPLRSPQPEAAQLDSPPQAERCQRRRSDGSQCQRPAHSGLGECLPHYKWYLLVPGNIPYPDDATALKETLAQILGHMIGGKLTPQAASAAARVTETLQKLLWDE